MSALGETLVSLPQELIDNVLRHLADPHDLMSVACTHPSLHAKVVTSPVWFDLLHSYWRFDNSAITDIFAPPTRRRRQHQDAYAEFCRRMVEEKKVGAMLESLVSCPRGRLKVVDAISKQFMDNADAVRRYRLARGRARGDFAVDYHCLNVERHLSRKLGFHILDKIHKHEDDDLAQGYSALFALFAVSCFRETDGLDLNLWAHVHGMFTRHMYGRHEPDEDVSNDRDRRLYAEERRRQWGAMSIERRIADVGVCMTSNGYAPADPSNYNDLASTFLGNAMLDRHVTIPINLVAVFCALCQEFGLQAKPVGFPGQMLAVVQDGGRSVYVSPFDGFGILDPAELETRLMGMGYGYGRNDLYRPVSGREVVIRCARNVFDRLERGTVSANGMPALYGALTSLKMVGQRGPLAEAQFSALVAIHYPYDIAIWDELNEPEWEDHILRTRLSDITRRTPKRRFEQTREIGHKCGVVFRHRLFGYYAVITGWDSFCDQSEHWIQQMRVDSLPFGRYQPFYHALVVDGSSRYVAQENIIPLPNPEIDEDAIAAAATIGGVNPATTEARTADAAAAAAHIASDRQVVDPRTTQARQRLLARFGLFENHNELAAAGARDVDNDDEELPDADADAGTGIDDAGAGAAVGGGRRSRPTTARSEAAIEREHARRTAAQLCANPEIGRYFRHHRRGKFVLGSDLREEYPDDIDHDLDLDADSKHDAQDEEAKREARRRRDEELDEEVARLS